MYAYTPSHNPGVAYRMGASWMKKAMWRQRPSNYCLPHGALSSLAVFFGQPRNLWTLSLLPLNLSQDISLSLPSLPCIWEICFPIPILGRYHLSLKIPASKVWPWRHQETPVSRKEHQSPLPHQKLGWVGVQKALFSYFSLSAVPSPLNDCRRIAWL